jgi:hypothetical protein
MTRESPATFIAYEDLAANRRVKFHTGTNEIEYADAADNFIGVTIEAGADGEGVAVELKRAARGSVEVELASSCSASDVLYGADDGKVSTVSSAADRFGIACEDGSASGAIVEALIDD